MSHSEKHIIYKQPVNWTGDLDDDCMANWYGLLLRAELMETNRWWWCVYDMLDNEKQIDSSNEHKEIAKFGDEARKKAEKAARKYLKIELVLSKNKRLPN